MEVHPHTITIKTLLHYHVLDLSILKVLQVCPVSMVRMRALEATVYQTAPDLPENQSDDSDLCLSCLLTQSTGTKAT